MWKHAGDQGVLKHPRDQGVLQPETPKGGSQLPTLQEHLMESLPPPARGTLERPSRGEWMISFSFFCVREVSGWLELTHAGVLG